MAKRKRLLPLGGTTDDLADLPVLETKAMFPGYPQGYAGGHTYSRPAPIADMAGAAAATAAMEEMAETLPGLFMATASIYYLKLSKRVKATFGGK